MSAALACAAQASVAACSATGRTMRSPAFTIRPLHRHQGQQQLAAAAARQLRGRQQRPCRAAAVRVQALRNIDWPEALLFDCDGEGTLSLHR